MRPAILDPLFAPVTTLPGIGTRLAKFFERLAGPLVVDLLWHLPSGIVDRRASPPIKDLQPDQIVTVAVRVEAHQPGRGPRPYRVICADPTGRLTLTYFNVKGDYLSRLLPIGAERVVSGRVEFYNRAPQITHPDLVLRADELDRLKPIEPVYPLTAGLSPRVVQRAVEAAVDRAPQLPEWTEPTLGGRRNWPSWAEAVHSVHSPTAEADLSPTGPARERLAYDEVFASQLAVALVRARRRRRKGRSLAGSGTLTGRVETALGFALTGAQCLAVADIPLQQAHHAPWLRHVCGDFGDRQTLRRGQHEAERGFDPAGQRPRPDERTALLAAAARADQCNGELAGEHLVIGKPLARRLGRREIGLSGWGVNLVNRVGPVRPEPVLAKRRADPLGQVGGSVECGRHCPLHDPRREPGGQRVDRLDRLQPVELVGPQHEVRVGDLGCTAIELDATADHALGADRQEAREVVALDVEIGQGQSPGRVSANYPIGPRAAAGLVHLDAHRDGHDLVGLQLLDRRRSPAVDDAARQMPQEVDDERAGEAFEQLGELRTDAGERCHRREQQIEDGRTHTGSLYPRRGNAKSTCDLVIGHPPQAALVPFLASRDAGE